MLALTDVRTLILSLGAAIALGACGVEDAKPAGNAGQAKAADAEPGYTVDIELPPEPRKGQESIARVRVRPKSPWHMNLDYPAKLRLEAPEDVTLSARQQSKSDAERYDDDALVFTVPFTPEAKGARKIQAQLDFAVCGEAACGSVTESVELAFEVSCRDEDTGLC